MPVEAIAYGFAFLGRKVVTVLRGRRVPLDCRVTAVEANPTPIDPEARPLRDGPRTTPFPRRPLNVCEVARPAVERPRPVIDRGLRPAVETNEGDFIPAEAMLVRADPSPAFPTLFDDRDGPRGARAAEGVRDEREKDDGLVLTALRVLGRRVALDELRRPMDGRLDTLPRREILDLPTLLEDLEAECEECDRAADPRPERGAPSLTVVANMTAKATAANFIRFLTCPIMTGPHSDENIQNHKLHNGKLYPSVKQYVMAR